MNSPYTQAQLELILQLLSCPSGQEPELLEANITLINADLVEMMQQVAKNLSQQVEKKDAEWLVNLAQKLGQFLSLELPETKVSHYSPNRTNQYQIFMQVLQAVLESGSNLQRIYPLLEAHVDQLDAAWIDLLQNWTNSIFPQKTVENAEIEQAEVVAAILYNVGNLFLEFSQGSLSLNLEIAIASYKLALDIYRQLGFQENLFQTLTNLGSAYSRQAETGIYIPANLRAIDCYNCLPDRSGQKSIAVKVYQKLGER